MIKISQDAYAVSIVAILSKTPHITEEIKLLIEKMKCNPKIAPFLAYMGKFLPHTDIETTALNQMEDAELRDSIAKMKPAPLAGGVDIDAAFEELAKMRHQVKAM